MISNSAKAFTRHKIRKIFHKIFYQAHKKSVEELIHFVDAKMLPPETASRIFKHVEFQASASILLPRKHIPDLYLFALPVCHANYLFQ